MTTPTYKLTGNTYPHREAIKARGFRWDPVAKAWFGKIGGNGWELTARELRRGGVKVERMD